MLMVQKTVRLIFEDYKIMYFLQQKKSFIWKHHQLKKVKTWITDKENNGNNNHDIDFEESSSSHNEIEDLNELN